MDRRQEEIHGSWMRGEFQVAERMAKDWQAKSPGVMPLLILAETYLLQRDKERTLKALQSAQPVAQDHPMYLRLICLSALQFHAFTAAHGALFGARTVGLPEAIVSDLESKVRDQGLMDAEGNFPTAEDKNPEWRALLLPMWHVRSDKVPLVWAEHEGQLVVWREEFAAVAAEVVLGGGSEVWERHPVAHEIASRLSGYDVANDIPEPTHLSSIHGIALLGIAHILGFFPFPLSNSVFAADLAQGRITHVANQTPQFTLVSHVNALDPILNLLPMVFEGRISISGPDERLARGLPWLLDADTLR